MARVRSPTSIASNTLVTGSIAPHTQCGERDRLAMPRRPVGLEEITTTARAMQLAPWSTVGRPIGTEIAQPHPALIGTGGLRAAMRRRVHLARAATRGDDTGWGGAGRLWAR